MKKIHCATLQSYEAVHVDVESTFLKALPGFSITGLANNSVLESRDRVKSALQFIHFRFPPLKININLSPAEIAKEGSHFDLPIALSVALQKEDVSFEDIYVFGELGLDGAVKETNSLFAMILSLKKQGLIKRAIIPKSAMAYISNIPDLLLYGVDTLQEAIDFFKEAKAMVAHSHDLAYDYIDAKGVKYYYQRVYEDDFSEVRGQEVAKRASLIAALGFHNLLFNGSPGSGKSMSIKRLAHILPPLTQEELLENAKLHTLDKQEISFVPKRPFRAVHHSATKASILGGGSKNAMLGEISLSHNGILFFDEVVHFPKTILESLREPLEEHKLLISRVNAKVEYDTKFLFACAMNPCPCGNLLSISKECRCSDVEIERYNNKLSDPLLDRIDMFVVMSESTPEDKPSISSAQMHEAVLKGYAFSKKRGQNEFNGKLSTKEIKKYCILTQEAKAILDTATRNFSLTQRGVDKTLKVARTIADLDARDEIEKKHILEALSFRKR